MREEGGREANGIFLGGHQLRLMRRRFLLQAVEVALRVAMMIGEA